MNLISLNIRGPGNQGKKDWVRNLRALHQVSFIMLQEIQFASLESVNLDGFWGTRDYRSEWVEATGCSGGLISLWDAKLFNATSLLKNRYYLLVSGVCKSSGKEINFLNRERRNSKFNVVSTREFNDFIEDAGLHEFALKGRKFTFCSCDKLSRIDRFLVCWRFMNDWPNAEYRALAKEKSDHCPLLLKTVSKNFGPKPFHFLNSWLGREDFEGVVVRKLTDFRGVGPPDILLLQKFRSLRKEIMEWRNKMKGLESEEEVNLKQEIYDLEVVMEERDFTEIEAWVFEESK
ncbi:uncharacterized protein LOC143621271 [Bidens hawaiensis]|uniref:uncharacterized protein LOC143621271 n=1 Tax=Bidens hawaiensis TaxID=980011 RepID=UPI00404A1154